MTTILLGFIAGLVVAVIVIVSLWVMDVIKWGPNAPAGLPTCSSCPPGLIVTRPPTSSGQTVVTASAQVIPQVPVRSGRVPFPQAPSNPTPTQPLPVFLPLNTGDNGLAAI